MISKLENLPVKQRRGENGETSLVLTDLADFPGRSPKLKMFSRVQLLPGQKLAYHEHHGESEQYFILSGTGVYNDNGTEIPVGPGCVTCTRSGSGHGLENTGDEALELLVFEVAIGG